MNTNLIPTKVLADFLNVSIFDLKNWRRLPPDHPRRLSTVRFEGKSYYDMVEVLAWLQRPKNARYLDTVVAAFAPPEVIMSLSQARMIATTDQPASPVGPGLLAGFDHPQEAQHG